MSGIVLSYRREDAEGSAGRLYDRIAARYGAEFVFMDYYSIDSGEDWSATIDEAVAAADVVLAVIGPGWATAADDDGRRRLDHERDYVRHELRSALEAGVKVVPVLVQRARMVRTTELPEDLRALTAVQNVTVESRHYDRDLERLYRVIDDVVAFGGDMPRFDERSTAVAGFVGLAPQGPMGEPTLLTAWRQFRSTFGDVDADHLLGHAVYGWFENGGESCVVVRVAGDDPYEQDALAALERSGTTIIAAPDLHGRVELQAALVAYAERSATMAILDPPPGLAPQGALEWVRDSLRFDTAHAAVYYPWPKVFDPASSRTIAVPPSGHVAGTWARVDTERGPWAAPANLPLRTVLDLETRVTVEERFALAGASINVLDSQPGRGIRVWGARTLSSDPARREIATVRTSHAVGAYVRDVTAWAAFERSGARTWNRLQAGVDVALDGLWRKGAFAGETASDAFYVRAGADVNVPDLAAGGRIRVEFGFALEVPGEFVHMSVEQPSGDVAVYAD